VIETYLKRHAEIHRAVGAFDEFLTQETDQLRNRLKETESELRKAKTNAGVISLDDTKKGFSYQMAKIQQAIFDAEAELAERQAAVGELSKLLNPKPAATTNETAATPISSTNAANSQLSTFNSKPNTNSQLSTLNASTNGTKPGSPITEHVSRITSSSSNSQPSTLSSQPGTNSQQDTLSTNVPSAKLTEYKRVSNLLETLDKNEQELSLHYTATNALVRSVRQQIADNTRLKEQLEQENPGLLAVKVSEPKPGPAGAVGPTADPRADLVHEMARVTALESRMRTLTNQLANIRTRATTVDAMEGSITELQRKKELEEAHYKYFSANLEQSKIDEALGAGHVSNISIIQVPSPPFRDNVKMLKAQAMLLFGGVAGALALAFLLELYFDRSLKRPGEIERNLGIPLFLSIPQMNLNGNGKSRSLKGAPNVPLLEERSRRHEEAEPDSQPSTLNSQLSSSSTLNPQLSTNDSLHSPLSTLHSTLPLRPFFETLRDRLIAFFELKNLTHKPKLVAVTSCGEGAGVTTAAAGLAASLSETGEGNVLLVDMNLQQGAAHHFYKGHLECGLDDALEVGKRDSALVQENLYVVTESTTNGDQLPRVLPKRFKHLVPKLRASDYDYIIFDMPPVSQISATPRIARFMDMVFLVVESEKTDRDVVKRATNLLAESKCNLGVILNKNKAYVPKLLQQEL